MRWLKLKPSQTFSYPGPFVNFIDSDSDCSVDSSFPTTQQLDFGSDNGDDNDNWMDFDFAPINQTHEQKETRKNAKFDDSFDIWVCGVLSMVTTAGDTCQTCSDPSEYICFTCKEYPKFCTLHASTHDTRTKCSGLVHRLDLKHLKKSVLDDLNNDEK